MVKAVPEGYHTVTPYLTVSDARQLLEFIKEAFGAKVLDQLDAQDGSIRHAEAQIGDSRVMVGQARDEWTPRPSTIYLYVENTDETYQRAIRAGAKSLMEPADQFYGDRNGGVEDSQGNWWWIATRVEDLSSEELARRAKANMK